LRSGSFEFDLCQKSRGSSPKRTKSIPLLSKTIGGNGTVFLNICPLGEDIPTPLEDPLWHDWRRRRKNGSRRQALSGSLIQEGRDRAPRMGSPRRRLFLSGLMILLAAWTSSAGAVDDSAPVECTLEQGNGGTQHTAAQHVRRTAGNFKGSVGPGNALAQPHAFA